jgi:hypothetical protein
MDGGWGLAPNLSTPIPKHISIQIYNKKHLWACQLGGPSQSVTHTQRLWGRIWPTTYVLNQCQGDTWHPLSGPRVSISFTINDTCHSPTHPQSYQTTLSMCHTALPRVVRSATSTSVWTVRAVQSTHFFAYLSF